MSKEQNVINYYVLCNKLKNITRTGWTDWKVNRNRIESIAEHVYGTQMLAIAMKSEYNYDIDIMKVILMLSIHEIGETIIGDLTQFQIDANKKEKIEHEAVHKILSSLIDGEMIEKLFLEFDAHETKEAKFAYLCDKLECDLQSKLYDQEGVVDLKHQEENDTINNELVKKLLNEDNSFSDMWIKFGQIKYPYDNNFMKVSNYALNNELDEPFTKKLK